MAAVVHLLVPAGIDDPMRPSGGNTYDRRLCRALKRSGWSVRLVEVPGSWPGAGCGSGRDALTRVLEDLADGSLVVVDGLLVSSLATVVVPACHRLRVVVLVHMPWGLDTGDGPLAQEGEVLAAASAVVAPSAWARSWLLAAHGLDPAGVHVARPGVDVAPRATGHPRGGSLLCVGAVTRGKGQDVLLAALARVSDLAWRCECVGSLSVSPAYVAGLRRDVRRLGLDERFVLTGALARHDLGGRYAEADALVVASRAETYGMVVSEALARGLPVIAAEVGGVPEALGTATDGSRPGLLVAPDDVAALAATLRLWLSDAARRDALREAAAERRRVLTRWSETADRVGRVLREVTA
jgi:glycosyltransferase involved in cell wall biosynthesis